MTGICPKGEVLCLVQGEGTFYSIHIVLTINKICIPINFKNSIKASFLSIEYIVSFKKCMTQIETNMLLIENSVFIAFLKILDAQINHPKFNTAMKCIKHYVQMREFLTFNTLLSIKPSQI